MAYTDYLDTVQGIYIAYYQRAADPGGLIYWAERLDASGGNLNQIIEAFSNCPESQTLYGTISSSNISTVVDDIYYALFGRHAEASGLAYWVNGFNSHQFTAATIMLEILNGAQGSDLQTVHNKVFAAELFTRNIDPELDGQNFLYNYSGDADAEQGREFLKPITDNPLTIPDAKQFIEDNIADPAPTVALTQDTGASSTDNITNNADLTIGGTESGATVQYSTDGTTFESTFTATEGANTVYVRQVVNDIPSTVSDPFTFTLDTKVSAPIVMLTKDTGSSLTDSITSKGDLTIGGGETGATVQYSTDGTTWTSTFTPTEGANTVYVRQTDLAGNVSESGETTFTLDTTVSAPTVALTKDTGSSTKDKITNEAALTTITETGATVGYSTDGKTWTSTQPTATEGANKVYVHQTDLAGNVSIPSLLTFTLDTVAPVVTESGITLSYDPGSDFIVQTQTQTISATLSQALGSGETLYGSLDSGDTWTDITKSVSATTLTWKNQSLQEGKESIQLKVVDLAGNAGAKVSQDYEYQVPTFDLKLSSDSLTEGDTLTVTVSSDVALEEAKTFYINVKGDTLGGVLDPATSADFSPSSQAITIKAGQTEATATVSILNEGTEETLEGAKVTLLDSSYQTVDSGTFSIIDGTALGKTFTLTTGVDTKTGSTGDDTFDASLSSGSTTLNSGDVLNGGEGTDSLVATIATAGTLTPTLTSIENITVSAVGASASISLSKATGLTNLEVTGSSNPTTFSNISDTGVALKVTGQDQIVTFGFAGTAVAGAADSATLTLDNVSGGTITVAGIETLNVVSSGSGNTVTQIVATSAKTMNVTGDNDLDLGTAAAGTFFTGGSLAVTKVDASALTGKLTVNNGTGGAALTTILGGTNSDTINVNGVAAAAMSINGGAGSDEITFGTTNVLGSTDTVAGGDGTDTLVASVGSVDTTATATAYTNISGIEKLEISNALSGTVSTARVQAGISTVTLAGGGTGTLTLEAGAQTVNLKATALAGTLTINDTAAAITDSLTIANTSTTALNVGATKDLAIGGFETVTVNTTGAGAATQLTFGAIGITPDTGGSATLNFTGSNSVSIAAVTATSASSLTINASGLTGDATFTQTAAPVRATITTGATNITGSANADTIYAATTGTTVDGGAGKDTIYGGTLVDSLAGGTGNDTFEMAAVLTSADTISGGDGTDTISITADALDAVFTNVTSVETVTTKGTIALTLGALATTAGVNKVTLGTVTTVETTNVGADFTNDLTVVMAATGTPDAEVVDAAAYTKNLTLQTANSVGLSAGTFTGGKGTADQIVYDLTTAAIVQGGVAGITAIEKITTTGSTLNDLSVTLDSANIGNGKTLTIDGSALTTGILTVVGTSEADGKLVVTGGGAADLITGTASSYGDNLSGGAGADTFTMAANLASTDTISGGAGTDIVKVSGTVADAAFTNVSTVETLTATAAATITLGALAQAAGIATVNDHSGTIQTITVGSGVTNALAVKITGDTSDSVIATAYTGALTVSNSTASTALVATNIITGGTGTSDKFVFDLTGASITQTAGSLAGVSKIETFATKGSTTNSLNITLADANTASGKSLTIDGSALTSGVLTVDAALETNGSIVVKGGGADDLITGSASSSGDSLSGGTGIDTFTFATANLTSSDTVSGGGGVDILSISDASTIEDADFTNITSVETLQVGAGVAQTVTLGALANAAGIATITGSGAFVDTVTVGAGFTNALTLNIATGADNIDGSASAAALNVKTLAASVTAADTIKGGTSTGDTLTLTADGGAAADTTLMTGIETITVVAAGATISITMGANDTQIAAGKTLTVDASALTNAGAALTFTGTASELDGYLNITGGVGNDTITGGGYQDTIVGGSGLDRITGGLAADQLTGGVDADTFVYTNASVAASNTATYDSITDWTSAADKLEVTLSYSTLTSVLTINATRAAAGVAGVTLAQDALSGSRGQYIYDTTNSALYINVNNDNLITTSDFKIGLNAGSTASATVVEGDINFVITGGTNDDIITAGSGADTISGGAGADAITGGGGLDQVTGDAGNDVYSSTATAATDAVYFTDFTTAQDDFDYNGTLLNAGATTVGTPQAGATLDAALTSSATATAYVINLAANDGPLTTAVTAYLASRTAVNADAVEAAAITAISTHANLDTDIAVTESVLIAVDNDVATVGESMVFRFANTTATGNVINAGELTLIGVLGTGDLVIGDFV